MSEYNANEFQFEVDGEPKLVSHMTKVELEQSLCKVIDILEEFQEMASEINDKVGNLGVPLIEDIDPSSMNLDEAEEDYSIRG